MIFRATNKGALVSADNYNYDVSTIINLSTEVAPVNVDRRFGP
jgi:hypothetical protein